MYIWKYSWKRAWVQLIEYELHFVLNVHTMLKCKWIRGDVFWLLLHKKKHFTNEVFMNSLARLYTSCLKQGYNYYRWEYIYNLCFTTDLFWVFLIKSIECAFIGFFGLWVSNLAVEMLIRDFLFRSNNVGLCGVVLKCDWKPW